MTDDGRPDDQAVLAILGAIADQVDGPPELAFELGRSAFTWRDADADLARLVADSASEVATVRSGSPDRRLLSFEVGDVIIELQVTTRQRRRSLLGQVIPEPASSGGQVKVETSSGPALSTSLDPAGRFEVADVGVEGRDRLRLRVDVPGATPVTTVWISL